MEKDSETALNYFIKTASEELTGFLVSLQYDSLFVATQLIKATTGAGGRVHISGIGKSAHVASYIAALFSSTGTPSYYLDATEAVHGSCGQLKSEDIVICISNSGETKELINAIQAILNNGCKIIAVTGNPDSWIARHGAVHLCTKVYKEGGPLNRAPRLSILAQTIQLQALSVILQVDRQITPEQYVKWHPGGALGKLEIPTTLGGKGTIH